MNGPRPRVLVVVLGTATEVGKTWASAAVLADLARRGRSVSARKPAQSFAPTDAHPTDAQLLGAATGEAPEQVCPERFSYPVPMAPPMAAAELGRPVPTMADLLVGAAPWSAGIDVGLIESVGGPRSPLADDADSVDLVIALRPDLVVLVADAGLGTVNAVRLSGSTLDRPPIVLLNRWDEHDPLHRRNRDRLVDDGTQLVTGVDRLADRVELALS